MRARRVWVLQWARALLCALLLLTGTSAQAVVHYSMARRAATVTAISAANVQRLKALADRAVCRPLGLQPISTAADNVQRTAGWCRARYECAQTFCDVYGQYGYCSARMLLADEYSADKCGRKIMTEADTVVHYASMNPRAPYKLLHRAVTRLYCRPRYNATLGYMQRCDLQRKCINEFCSDYGGLVRPCDVTVVMNNLYCATTNITYPELIARIRQNKLLAHTDMDQSTFDSLGLPAPPDPDADDAPRPPDPSSLPVLAPDADVFAAISVELDASQRNASSRPARPPFWAGLLLRLGSWTAVLGLWLTITAAVAAALFGS